MDLFSTICNNREPETRSCRLGAGSGYLSPQPSALSPRLGIAGSHREREFTASHSTAGTNQ